MYKDYLSKVRKQFDEKKKKLFHDRSMFSNYGQHILFLPPASQKRIREKMERKHTHEDNEPLRNVARETPSI